MKNVLWTCLFGILALSIFSACAKSPSTDSSRKYQVLWPDGQGNYTLQSRAIPTLTDAQKLSGTAAEVVINPQISYSGLDSPGMHARYIIESGGSWIPSDYTSLQGITIYAHSEALMQMDIETGAAKLMRYPTRIGMFNNGAERSITNNAFYSMTDFMVFGEYDGPMLPTSLNAGVISHEHFHKIFQALVHDPLSKKTSRPWRPQFFHEWAPHGFEWAFDSDCASSDDYNIYLIRGINEGLADYWAWIYTKDSQFIERSLGFYDMRVRSLEGKVSELADQDLRAEYNRYVRRSECHLRNPYLVGTRIARWMKSVAEAELTTQVTSPASRLEIGKRLIKALPRLVDVAVQTRTGDLQMSEVMRVLVESNPTQLSCSTYSQQMRTALKPAGCP